MSAELADLVRRWHALRATHGSSRPLYELLVPVWRAADAAHDTSADRLAAPLLEKWVCRLLWEQLQRSEAAVPDRVKGLLARTGVWSVEQAVFSVWAATVARRSECGDHRYLEHALEDVLDCLVDSALPELVDAVERVDQRLDGLLAHRLVRRLVDAGNVEAARRAAALARTSLWTTLCLAELAPVLEPDEREAAIQRAWARAEQEMAAGDDQRAYRSNEWAELVRLSAPDARRPRAHALARLVDSIPPALCEQCQDHEDLRALVAEALASIGDEAGALAWVMRIPEDDRLWSVSGLIPHLAQAGPMALELAEQDDADVEYVLTRIAAGAPALATRCLEIARTRVGAEDPVGSQLRLVPHVTDDEVEQILRAAASDADTEREYHVLRALKERADLGRLRCVGEVARSIEAALAIPKLETLVVLAGLAGDHARVFAAIQTLAPRAKAEGDDAVVARAVKALPAPWLASHRIEVQALLHDHGDVDDVELVSLLDPALVRARALEQLAAARATVPHGRVGLVYDLSVASPGAIRTPAECAAILVGPDRATLAHALFDAGPWARLAMLSHEDVGWAYFVEQVLIGARVARLDTSALVEACKIDSASALATWLVEHPPPAPDRMTRDLELPQLTELERALNALPVLPDWAAQLFAPPPHRSAPQALKRILAEQDDWKLLEAVDRLDGLDADQLRLVAARLEERSSIINPAWSHVARRWAELGDAEQAVAAARRVSLGAYQRSALLDVGLALGLTDVVEQALAGMAREYDPVIYLFPGSKRACGDGRVDQVLNVARALADPFKRVGVLAAAAGHLPPGSLRDELESTIMAMIEIDPAIHDDAFGRVARLVGPEVKLRMWSHAFSFGQHTQTLRFSWQSTTALEVTASLREGDARELVTWAARLAAPDS